MLTLVSVFSRKYYWLLVRFPYLVIAVTLLLVATLWGVGLAIYPPSYLAKCFENPTKVSHFFTATITTSKQKAFLFKVPMISKSVIMLASPYQ